MNNEKPTFPWSFPTRPLAATPTPKPPDVQVDMEPQDEPTETPREEAERLGCRLPDANDPDDYYITLALSPKETP